MISLVWNVCGLGGPRAFCNAAGLVHEVTSGLLFISESGLSQSNVLRFKSFVNFKNCFCVNPIGRKGGLLLCWNESINVSILSYSPGHIDCVIENNPESFYFTDFFMAI